MNRFFSLMALLLIMTCSAWAGNDGVVRILAVGNSFAEDAVEQNLHELAAAEGIRTVIVNMYIGGCSLERHTNNVKTNRADYAMLRIGEDGVKQTRKQVTLQEALESEEWDYVSVQQVSQLSGIYDSYAAFLPDLLAYLRAHLPATTKLVLHQTWAYAADSKHKGFANYNRDQEQMYRAIVKANRKVSRRFGLKPMIPSGTAVQNVRTSFVGDHVTRDGYHLDRVLGRYIAACTWFERLFGRSVVGNPYAPEGLDPAQKQVAQEAAHAACRRPHRVTPMQ
jgi:hypothetical protein